MRMNHFIKFVIVSFKLRDNDSIFILEVIPKQNLLYHFYVPDENSLHFLENNLFTNFLRISISLKIVPSKGKSLLELSIIPKTYTVE